MLTIPGHSRRYCDGVSRRSFLRLGALAFSGLSLSDVLRSRANAASSTRSKSVIMIFLGGGPPHLDMYDMKPEAPRNPRRFPGDFHECIRNQDL